jgi:3-oxoacyl-[acyl-carrier-protein] synthase II
LGPVAQATPRDHAWSHALSTNSAFGGANASVCVSRLPSARPARARREVFVSGAGVVGPFGLGLSALSAWQGDSPRLAPFELEALAPTVDTRGMDQTARALTAAVALALAEARLTISGALRERTGIFVGTTNASPAVWTEFRTSVRERGLLKLSAPAFTRLVLNAAAGTATRVFGLCGPTTTLTTGQGSGLVALALAVAHLESRTDATRLVAAAVDEADLERAPQSADAAAALVLSTEPTADAVRVRGWALGGPGQSDAVARLACERAGVPVTTVRAERRIDALASGSLLALAQAFDGLRAGPGTRLVVDASSAASCAVVLERSY